MARTANDTSLWHAYGQVMHQQKAVPLGICNFQGVVSQMVISLAVSERGKNLLFNARYSDKFIKYLRL